MSIFCRSYAIVSSALSSKGKSAYSVGSEGTIILCSVHWELMWWNCSWARRTIRQQCSQDFCPFIFKGKRTGTYTVLGVMGSSVLNLAGHFLGDLGQTMSLIFMFPIHDGMCWIRGFYGMRDRLYRGCTSCGPQLPHCLLFLAPLTCSHPVSCC